MQVALLGSGKTGSKVAELLNQDPAQQVTCFNRSHAPTLANLKAKKFDVAICFLPGEAFLQALPALMEAKLPVVVGSTGFAWPESLSDMDHKLKVNRLSWIHAHNFGLGMNLVYLMIKALAKTPKLFEHYEFMLHEIHHTKKLDAPSGTAKSWAQWLQPVQGEVPVEITSERTGDVIGDHELKLETPFERISIRHEALDRKIFAAGAIWAAKKLVSGQLPHGLLRFEEISQKELSL